MGAQKLGHFQINITSRLVKMRCLYDNLKWAIANICWSEEGREGQESQVLQQTFHASQNILGKYIDVNIKTKLRQVK